MRGRVAGVRPPLHARRAWISTRPAFPFRPWAGDSGRGGKAAGSSRFWARAKAPCSFLYDLSILQAECALTPVFDRPGGGILFEEIIRENLDIGRADHVQSVFGRRITRRAGSRFRTRIIADGVLPSLHIDYQALSHQAALQGRPRVADRDGDRQHVRLRRQAQAVQSR
ncbi:MAG: hypothetical protein F4X97_04495 [Boseongicola sp. SB0662_bin_57]|nr:hypothetical protein [Boseongicola sp. SB0662_bin_57]